MVVINRPAGTISFGTFSQEKFGTVLLPTIASDNSGLTGGPAVQVNGYFNDAAVPVKYVIAPGTTPELWDSLIDTGATASFQASPIPSNLQFIPFNPPQAVAGGVLQSQVSATLDTTLGTMPIFLTDSVDVYDTTFNGPSLVNVGNEMPNRYQILLDQATGRWGIAPLQ
jgi:hypothetical protein